MERVIIGSIVVIVGLLTIIFRKKVVNNLIDFQNEAFGLHFGKKTKSIHNKFAIPFGLFLIIFGLIILLDLL